MLVIETSETQKKKNNTQKYISSYFLKELKIFLACGLYELQLKVGNLDDL
jgi:hypothetical protein